MCSQIIEIIIKNHGMYSEKMENYHKKHGKCSENHGKAPKNDGPELPPVGAQAWKIPNLVANGAQHLLQKEICREKKNTEHQYIIDALANLHTLIITQEYLRSDTIF